MTVTDVTFEVKFKGDPVALVDMKVLDKDLQADKLDTYKNRARMAVVIQYDFKGKPSDWTSNTYKLDD